MSYILLYGIKYTFPVRRRMLTFQVSPPGVKSNVPSCLTLSRLRFPIRNMLAVNDKGIVWKNVAVCTQLHMAFLVGLSCTVFMYYSTN